MPTEVDQIGALFMIAAMGIIFGLVSLWIKFGGKSSD